MGRYVYGNGGSFVEMTGWWGMETEAWVPASDQVEGRAFRGDDGGCGGNGVVGIGR